MFSLVPFVTFQQKSLTGDVFFWISRSAKGRLFENLSITLGGVKNGV